MESVTEKEDRCMKVFSELFRLLGKVEDGWDREPETEELIVSSDRDYTIGDLLKSGLRGDVIFSMLENGFQRVLNTTLLREGEFETTYDAIASDKMLTKLISMGICNVKKKPTWPRKLSDCNGSGYTHFTDSDGYVYLLNMGRFVCINNENGDIPADAMVFPVKITSHQITCESA